MMKDPEDSEAHHDKKELHIAPMLDVSNREFREFFRILSRKCVLWTEMVVDETLFYSENLEEHIGMEPDSPPIVLQIGGSNPELAAQGVKLVEHWGYNEVNLNCECPSSRVSGRREFGAALMKKRDIAVDMIKSMSQNVQGIPVSVKTRIGVDEEDSFDFLVQYISAFTPYCKRFVIHARKVYLNGLNPAQNRRVPPLNYPLVYQLCKEFPDCEFWINGGITTLQAAKGICYGTNDVSDEHHGSIPCTACDALFGSCVAPPTIPPPNLMGCMLGRAAMDNPAQFWDVDRYFYGEESNPCHNRREVLEKYCNYLDELYPRRCCDDDDRITCRLPAPNIVRSRMLYCRVCKRGGIDLEEQVLDSIQSTKNAPVLGVNGRKRHERHSPGTKITSRVIDRALKPALNIFAGEPGSKRFKRACFVLSRDLQIRNCGPAFILRNAISESISDAVLDKGFCKTEDCIEYHFRQTVRSPS